MFSDGAESVDFILSDEDMRAAFNRFGVCAANSNVEILGFNIEDTHIHGLLYGEYDECTKFSLYYESLTRYYLQSNRSSIKSGTIEISLLEITDERYLRNTGSYVIVQPTKDGKKVMPYDYMWGTGCMYFRQPNYVPVWRLSDKGKLEDIISFGSLNYREKRRITHSQMSVPDDWQVCNGLILPSNYVNVKMFEDIFVTHNCFRVFLASTKDKDQEVLSRMASVRGVQIEDLEARLLCSSICQQIFGKRGVKNLTTSERILLAQECRRRYRFSFRQLSSLVKIKESDLRTYVK